MAYDLEEQEQIEQIKAVWTKWGSLITSAVAIIAVGFAAYKGYQYYQRSQAEQAAPLFEQLEKAAATIEKDQAETQAKLSKDPKATPVNTDPKNAQLVADLAKKLTQEYASTAYAQLGALQAAKAQASLGKTAEADALLQWTVDSAKDPEYSYLARVRLANSLIDAKKPDQALALLAGDVPKGFEMLYADRRGDALAASNKLKEAGVEYQKAWDLTEKKSILREVIDQKMQGLGLELIKPTLTEQEKAEAGEKAPA